MTEYTFNLYQMIEAAKDLHKNGGLSIADATDKILDEQGIHEEIQRSALFNRINGEIRKKMRGAGRQKSLIRRDYPAEHIKGVEVKELSPPLSPTKRKPIQGRLF